MRTPFPPGTQVQLKAAGHGPGLAFAAYTDPDLVIPDRFIDDGTVGVFTGLWPDEGMHGWWCVQVETSECSVLVPVGAHHMVEVQS